MVNIVWLQNVYNLCFTTQVGLGKWESVLEDRTCTQFCSCTSYFGLHDIIRKRISAQNEVSLVPLDCFVNL
jgi:hypothetical protein